MVRALHWSLDHYPASWLTSVIVTRGGRTQAGTPAPAETFTIDQALVGYRSTADAAEWEDAPDDRATLYIERDQFQFQKNDLIEVPPGPWAAGRWQVDGRAETGPMGTEVPLRRRI